MALEALLPKLDPTFPTHRRHWLELAIRRELEKTPRGLPPRSAELRRTKDAFILWSGKSVNTVNNDWRSVLVLFRRSGSVLLDLPERARS